MIFEVTIGEAVVFLEIAPTQRLTLHTAAPRDNGKEQDRARFWPSGMASLIVQCGAVGRGDRILSGALCPTVNLVPGACGDIIGGAPARVPVWEIASLFTLPRS